MHEFILFFNDTCILKLLKVTNAVLWSSTEIKGTGDAVNDGGGGGCKM